MRLALMVIAVAANAAIAIGQGGASGNGATASIRLVRTQPLVVRGTRFHPRKPVSVTLYARRTVVRHTVADGRGSLIVSFGRASISRCERFRIVASGTSGSRAELKHVPPPACLPA
jgi:hypothetical protein